MKISSLYIFFHPLSLMLGKFGSLYHNLYLFGWCFLPFYWHPNDATSEYYIWFLWKIKFLFIVRRFKYIIWSCSRAAFYLRLVIMVHLFICLHSKFDLKCNWGRCRLQIIFFLPPLFSFWDLAHNLDKRLLWKYSVYCCQQTIHSINELEIINSNSLPDVPIHIPPWP